MGGLAAMSRSALVTRSGDDEAFFDLPRLGGVASATGLTISQITAIGVSTVFACISVRSKDIARCSPRLLKENSSRSEKPVIDHPVAKLFRRPNGAFGTQTWYEFALQMETSFLLRGNAYAAIIRDGRGDPIALIPVNPDAVTILEAPDGSVFYNVARFGFHQMWALKSFDFAIPEEDMFHLKGLSFNSLLGVSTIAVARDSIGVAMGLEQQSARFMANGARPSGVLQTEKKLTPEAALRLRTQWESLRAGIANAGKTAILEEGLKWEQMQLTSVDLEFIAQRKFSIEDIARWWGVPLHKLAVSGEVGKLRLDQADQAYVNSAIMPDLDMWEQKFGIKFNLDLEGLKADFDERRLLRAEEATRVNNQRLKIMSGISTQNEARAENGDPAVAGADVLLTPVNLAAVGSDMSGQAPDGAGRPEDGTLPDPGAANEPKKVYDPIIRVSHYIAADQSGFVIDALAGKRQGEALPADREDSST